MSLPVYFDPAIITTGAKPVQRSGESPAQFEERFIAWQTEMGMVDWDALIVNAMNFHISMILEITNHINFFAVKDSREA